MLDLVPKSGCFFTQKAEPSNKCSTSCGSIRLASSSRLRMSSLQRLDAELDGCLRNPHKPIASGNIVQTLPSIRSIAIVTRTRLEKSIGNVMYLVRPPRRKFAYQDSKYTQRPHPGRLAVCFCCFAGRLDIDQTGRIFPRFWYNIDTKALLIRLKVHGKSQMYTGLKRAIRGRRLKLICANAAMVLHAGTRARGRK